MLTDIRFAGDLSIEASAITPDYKNEEVLGLFAQKSSLQNLPVLLADGRPMGLINRNLFHSNMTKPFYPELYNQKSCIAFMDKIPLVVDATISIEHLTALAVEAGNKVFTDGFIIVEQGKYLGIGQVLDLMQAMTALQARQHRQLIESIEYASVIQQSLLKPSRIALEKHLPDDHWLIWEPRDVVGGDMFHFVPLDDGFLAVLFDCTGHGVPGAFMTLIAESALEQALISEGRHDPAALLSAINRHIKRVLNQHTDASGGQENSDDGLDGIVVRYNQTHKTLTYAGAHQSLFMVPLQNDAPVVVLTGDRQGVGYIRTQMTATWKNHTLDINEPCRIFILSDGVIDQVGGPKNIAFGKRRLTHFLTQTRHEAMSDQQIAFLALFADYQGQQIRRDDLTLVALNINPNPNHRESPHDA
jgi:sigma-B regulation protein RsbU (phosphoserine phosphatase)